MRHAVGRQEGYDQGGHLSGRVAKRAAGVLAQRQGPDKSMKLQILSDLHLEMVKPPYSWRIPETAAEVVVLAGDIGVGLSGVNWAVREAERLQKCAVYVPGNHEYYGEQLNVPEKMRAVARGSRVHVLDLDEVMLEGVKFLGCTLWTDYLAFGRDHRLEAMDQAARFLNDHRLINRPHGFTPTDALECHERGRAWLEGKLATTWDGPTVVVSHHAPSLLGTDAKFRNDYLTGAFVSDLEELINRYSPTIWIHGHTHHCVREIVGKTRLVANQMGYPHEPATGQFDPDLVVEI
jgi:Icc-related predicted phosphoesterase